MLTPTRRTVLAGLAAGTAVAATTSRASAAARTGRPNVIVLSIDDLGWDELGCYGNTFNETPTIDRLAREGTRFTDAYAAAPTCSPTRAGLVTGRYPARTGITDFLRNEPAVSDQHLSPDVPTLPDVLGPLGYTTALIGKWHLTETYSGPYEQRPGNPYQHGFDEVRVSEQLYIGDGDYFHPYFFMPQLPAREPGEHLTDRLAAEAVDFVRTHRDRPFFLHVSNYAVHTALDGKPDLVAKYADKPGADALPNRPQLAAMLESVDQQVAALVAELERLGIAEQTLLLITSDNGGPYSDANTPLRGIKGDVYEGGIRVPLVAWSPGRVRAGRVEETVTSTIDVLPTAVDLAGGTAPADVDGVSLLPVLTGTGRVDRDTLFWVYPHVFGARALPRAAVRQGAWKLVMSLRDGSSELFHLPRDPAETTDLSARQPALTQRLRRLLTEHVRATGVLPAAPDDPRWSVPEAEETYDDAAAFDVLTVPGTAAATVTTRDGRAEVVSTGSSHVLLRSRTAPGSGEFCVVLDPGDFPAAGREETVFVGVAKDADNFVLLRYRHDLRRVGWDIRWGGRALTAGGEPLGRLDRTVDLDSPAARYALSTRDNVIAAYVDQGRGWEFLFRQQVAGVLDLEDPAQRAELRYASSVRLNRGQVNLDGWTARRSA